MMLVGRMMLVIALAAGAGEALGSPAEHTGGHATAREIEITAEDLGVEVLALRPTAADRMLEMRVRVIDPEKALRLLGRTAGHSLYLVDAKSGRAMGVPSTKVGTLRQTTVRPVAGQVYFVMFGNPGVVHPGEDVILVVGQSRLSGLVVQSKTGLSPPPDEKDRERAPEGEATSPSQPAAGCDTPSSKTDKHSP